ncbi:MAG: discoidin domain-containing protein [Rhodothermales bacterium]
MPFNNRLHRRAPLAAVLAGMLFFSAARPVSGQEYDVDLNTHPDGIYSEALMESDFGSVQLLNNLANRFTLVSDAEAREGASLRVTYVQGEIGAANSGGQFFAFLPARDEYYLDYYVKFADDFDFQLGGKLPGLSGGASNSGGNKPTGDGWSARYNWRENGRAVVYLYHLDQPSTFGQDLDLNRSFQPGVWHRLTQRIKVNTGNNNDGELQVWFDGELVFLRTDIRYRNNDQAPVDHFFFSTFHGGNTPEWAPDRTSYAYFDDIRIGTDPAVMIPGLDSGLLAQIDRPAPGAVFESPANIAIEASSFSLDHAITSIAFYANDVLLGQRTSPPYTFDWTNVAAGTYTLTARATDDTGSVATSTAVQLTVRPVDTAKGPNLALNRNVTVTSEQEGNLGSGAVDGSTDPIDRWSAQPFPQSVTIDLGAEMPINMAELVPYLDRAYQYEIATSFDGTSYTTVVDRTANTEGGALLVDSFAATSARYVKLTVTGAANYSGDWVSVVEFRLFGGGGSALTAGDATRDGTLSALDASFILQHTTGLITLPADAQTVSDVSANGTIGALDASLVLQRLVGLIPCFPVEAGCAGKR